MSNVIDFPDGKTIDAEASAWIARLDRGQLGEAETNALRQWIDRSPDHYASINRLAHLWGDLDILSEFLGQEPAQVPGQEKPANKWLLWISRLRPAPAAGFALILVAIALGIFFNRSNYSQKDVWHASYTTLVGEQRTLLLRDQSRIQLNTNTHIEVTFDKQQRKVRLLTGEALFEVAPNKARPFLVYAGSSVIRAVGTAFVVRTENNEIALTVIEGRVELASLDDDTQDPGTSPAKPVTTINAKQLLTRNRQVQMVQEMEEEELSRKLAWRDGLIVFSGEPLSYVVNEISRYTLVKFVITDPETSDLRIGGRFNIGEVDAMLDVLETGFGVEINRISKDLVHLSAVPQG